MSKSTVNASEQKLNTTKLKSTQNPILKAQGLDLSDLDEALGLLASDEQAAASRGKPLSLSLDKVIEDPDQPRKQFDPETLKALADSITIHGIKSPISVRSADTDGNYRINFGARRRRAAITAGLTEIPAFIDDDHDQYAQVVENIQRDEFKPMEIARFIAKEIANGEKPADIGKRLGHHKSWVSRYNALNDLPDNIKARAAVGDIADFNTLYEISTAAKKDPEQVAIFIETTTGHISRGALKEFQQSTASSDKPPSESQNQITSIDIGTITKAPTAITNPPRLEKPESINAEQSEDQCPDPTTISRSEDCQPTEISNPTYLITEPVIIVSKQGREGIMRLDITGPTGFGFIQFAEEEKAVSVSFNDLKIVRLTSKTGSATKENPSAATVFQT